MTNQPPPSRPANLLQGEALCVLIASFVAYHLLFPHHWVLFACLFFVPDLSLLLYARGPSTAASVVYNVMHSYVLPAVLGILAVLIRSPLLGGISMVWIGHIALDRTLGFGLKYATSFQFTHIQSAVNPVIPADKPRAQ